MYVRIVTHGEHSAFAGAFCAEMHLVSQHVAMFIAVLRARSVLVSIILEKKLPPPPQKKRRQTKTSAVTLQPYSTTPSGLR